MARSGTLTVRVIGDTSDFRRKMDGMGSKLKSAAKIAAAAGAVIATKFAADSVKAASDLEQSIGAVESVFGDASEKIRTFGETAAENFGLSKREVNETASVLGASLQSMGFGSDEAADQVVSLQERAADMAATFGGTTRDALDAVASLMRGERDPIEKYGVAIKQSDVNARLAAEGLEGLEGKAKKQAEAQAALDILFENTANSAGQFARESDTLAGRQARLSAKFENLKATVGNALMPIVLGALDLFEEWGEQIRDFLGPIVEEFGPIVKDIFEDVAAVVADVFTTVQNWFGRFESTLDGNAGALSSWYQSKVQPVVNKVVPLFRSAFDAVKAVVDTALTVIMAFWDRFGRHLIDFASRTFGRILNIVSEAFDVLAGLFDIIAGVLTGDWSRAWEGIKEVVGSAWEIIENIVTGAWDILKTAFGAGVAVISQAWSGLWAGIKGTVFSVVNSVIGVVEGMVNDIIRGVNIAIRAFNKISPRDISEVARVVFGRVGSGTAATPDPRSAGGGGGGVVAHSGGQFRTTALSGEGLVTVKDKEWLVPDEKMPSGGTVNHFHFPNYIGTPEDIKRLVKEALADNKRRNGSALAGI